MRKIITKTFGQVQYSTKTAMDCHDTLGFLGQYKYHATLLSIHHMTSYHHMLFIVHQYHQCTVLYVIQTILTAGRKLSLSFSPCMARDLLNKGTGWTYTCCQWQQTGTVIVIIWLDGANFSCTQTHATNMWHVCMYVCVYVCVCRVVPPRGRGRATSKDG